MGSRISVAAVIQSRTRSKSEATETLAAEYLQRASRYMPCEQHTYSTEGALLQALEQAAKRSATRSILLDSGGDLLSSQEFAEYLRTLRDAGIQSIYVAIGPANGWSAAAKARADLLFSLGRITLPHGLARAVLAEQLYRAMTILNGHPYHSGH